MAKSHAEHQVDYGVGYFPKNKKNCCPICRLSFHQPHWKYGPIHVIDCEKCDHAICECCHGGHFALRDQITICRQIQDRNKDHSDDTWIYCLDICCCGKPVNPVNKCNKCTYCYCDGCFKRHDVESNCKILQQN